MDKLVKRIDDWLIGDYFREVGMDEDLLAMNADYLDIYCRDGVLVCNPNVEMSLSCRYWLWRRCERGNKVLMDESAPLDKPILGPPSAGYADAARMPPGCRPGVGCGIVMA